jgi:acyl-CoA synthetase (AMP-forming)/AMP-acid ligase II
MIKTGGSNVAPAEVETALMELPDVREAFVFGIAAGERGEDVAAEVVPEGTVGFELVVVTAVLREPLSSYKIPRHMRIVDESDLPKLPTGKVDLASLRDLFKEP